MAIEFNPGDQGVQGSYNDPVLPSSKIVGWIMRTGLVRDEKRANYILMVCALFFFITSWYLYVFITPRNAAQSTVDALIIKSEISEEIRLVIPSDIYANLPETFHLKDIPEETLKRLPIELQEKLQ